MNLNKKMFKFYKNSFYVQFMEKYYKIQLFFFDERLANDSLYYMIDCYIAIIEILKKVKFSIRGYSNSEFCNIYINEEIYDIDRNYNNYKKDIENQLMQYKEMVNKNIESILVKNSLI